MAQSSLDNVVAHWDKLFENFHTSTTLFYASVEATLKKHEVPGLGATRVHWREGGIQSASREYLRIIGDRHCIDICAAPFGKAYFFSSWTSRHGQSSTHRLNDGGRRIVAGRTGVQRIVGCPSRTE